jgi:flagellar biosynthesis GTPase FlhF
VWRFGIQKYQLFNGCAGRLGTTTFIGFNIVTLLVFGPLHVINWDRYYYGFVEAIHVGEEDSRSRLGDAWSWTEEAESAIGYILACVWLGGSGGAIRILHHKHIQKQQQQQQSSNNPPAKPLNNVLVPVLLSLMSMLIVNVSGYKRAASVYNGFAVGAYVAMASLEKIPSVQGFCSVSLVSAGWGLAITPFCVGFAGKSGFTSMIGHVTHTALVSLIGKMMIRRQEEEQRRQQQEQHQQEMDRQAAMEEVKRQQEEDEERRQQQQQQQQQQNELTAPPSPQQSHRRRKSSYYAKDKETALLTKQQRRQQQRLMKHRQQQQQQQQSTLSEYQQQQQQQRSLLAASNPQPQLHHRAWSASLVEKTDDGIWRHPFVADE